jgi:hypothetical protein
MRNRLLQLLDRSEGAACETALRIESQRAIIARIKEREPGSEAMLSLLRQFESNLGLLMAHRDQLLRAASAVTSRARRREQAAPPTRRLQ